MSTGPVLSAGDIEELRYLRECGFTQRELARCFHIHQTTVGTYLRRFGDPLGGPAYYGQQGWKDATR